VNPAALLDGSHTPGVYRVTDAAEAVTSALSEAGWRTAVVPGVDSTTGFYTAVAAALVLPDYFGRNLDALWDCLTDLDAPTALVLLDWTRFARARPERWAALLALLTERTKQAPPFALVLA